MTPKRRFKINKLIRDKLPTLLDTKHIKVYTSILEDTTYLESLKAKLMEEANEVIHAKTALEIQEELADLLEVIQALCLAHNLVYDQVEATRQQKQVRSDQHLKRLKKELINSFKTPI